MLFAVSAGLQFNDPDPLFWVALYSGMAVIAGMAAFDKYISLLTIIGMAVTAYELFHRVPSFLTWVSDGAPSIVGSMQAESPHIESVREFLGILICFVVLLAYYIIGRRKKMSTQSAG